MVIDCLYSLDGGRHGFALRKCMQFQSLDLSITFWQIFFCVSCKFLHIALLLSHISMFLADLGLLQNYQKPTLINTLLFISLGHPRSRLLESSVDYVLL